MRRVVFAAPLAALAALVSACGGSNTTTTTPTSTTVYTTDVLTGTVPVPVDGALQSVFNTFSVGQGGGSVAVQLTSAVETLPGGSLLTGVSMGLGVGTVTGTTCTLMTNAYTYGAPGSAGAALTGTLSAGTYCVQVSDVTNQLGPVVYAVAVTHP